MLALIGGAGYLFLPGLLSELQEKAASKPAASTPAPAASAGGAGPMGEVNGAMDISEGLDAGAGASSPPRRAAPKQPNPAAVRAKPGTNVVTRPAQTR